ncbi:tRNA wybutosine-synthesizing protein 3 [Strigomonas culicis]|uniref:tRNA wybutosine-synthesizing protein 3 n=1 Tax=Strigomonas culicis TaxID=28005 RepID=S9VP19_9TRYP|nr:tRNA wybutosine-synthesizing protein 3 [Strigomonas culicis]|eukprot:EPY25055.1 tRNA wybutosine-synthesizing protein 3 [Strigomonas culicis]
MKTNKIWLSTIERKESRVHIVIGDVFCAYTHTEVKFIINSCRCLFEVHSVMERKRLTRIICMWHEYSGPPLFDESPRDFPHQPLRSPLILLEQLINVLHGACEVIGPHGAPCPAKVRTVQHPLPFAKEVHVGRHRRREAARDLAVRRRAAGAAQNTTRRLRGLARALQQRGRRVHVRAEHVHDHRLKLELHHLRIVEQRRGRQRRAPRLVRGEGRQQPLLHRRGHVRQRVVRLEEHAPAEAAALALRVGGGRFHPHLALAAVEEGEAAGARAARHVLRERVAVDELHQRADARVDAAGEALVVRVRAEVGDDVGAVLYEELAGRAAVDPFAGQSACKRKHYEINPIRRREGGRERGGRGSVKNWENVVCCLYRQKKPAWRLYPCSGDAPHTRLHPEYTVIDTRLRICQRIRRAWLSPYCH